MREDIQPVPSTSQHVPTSRNTYRERMLEAKMKSQRERNLSGGLEKYIKDIVLSFQVPPENPIDPIKYWSKHAPQSVRIHFQYKNIEILRSSSLIGSHEELSKKFSF